MTYCAPPLRSERSFGQRPPARQRGVALFVVIVFVLMTMLLALWGSRTSLFNEMVVGNDADYQRAFEAAQTLMQDAELDIRSAEPDASNKTLDGVDCSPGGDVCRMALADYQIPGSKEQEKVGALLDRLATQATGCAKGLCIKRSGKQDFWNDKTTRETLTKADIGARYGQFTGAAKGSASLQANPILADTSAENRGGWYWTEVLPYIKPSVGGPGLIVDAGAGANNAPDVLRPNLDPNVVYRITALAYGRKEGTMVVLQQTYAQQRRKD